MKKFVTLLLCMLPVSLFAQVNDGIRQAMDNYDYETVVTLIEPDCQDSLLLITKAQALKAMNRYPEAIGVLNSLILKDSTNTKVLIDLAECYKLTGNSRRAANCYQKAMNLQPENKFFRLQFIRSLLASEDYGLSWLVGTRFLVGHRIQVSGTGIRGIAGCRQCLPQL